MTYRIGAAPRLRAVPLATHLANSGRRSALPVLDDSDRHAFLTRERERLAEAFPAGEVEESYVVDLLVARRR